MKNDIYFDAIKMDKEKLKLLNEGILNMLISQFDDALLIKLRYTCHGRIPGSIFLYLVDTAPFNVEAKIELLYSAFKDEDFKLVQGTVDSINLNNKRIKTKDMDYFVPSLDTNTWFEVNKEGRIWVYDLFSLLKFDKEVYYKLENPIIDKIEEKDTVNSKFKNICNKKWGTCDDFDDDLKIKEFVSNIERCIHSNPYHEYLKAELTRIKKEINYEQVCKNIEEEKRLIYKSVEL